MTRTIPQIGELLRLARRVYPGGISRARLAVLSGVNYWHITDLERGITRPRPDDLDRLAATLNRPELAAVAERLRQARKLTPDQRRQLDLDDARGRARAGLTR